MKRIISDTAMEYEGRAKKGIKFFFDMLAICIFLMYAIPVNAMADNKYEEDIYVYDGIKYSGKEVTLEQMKNISPALLKILKEDEGVVLSIQDNNSGIAPLAIYPSSVAKGQLVVRRLSGSKVEFLLTVTRASTVNYYNYEDKIALSWAGGGALITDSCGIQVKYGGPYENVRCYRAEVSPNKGVSYPINPTPNEQSFLLRASVDNSHGGSQYKNVVGGYARKTFGVTGISTSFGNGSISFSASLGTQWDEMSPVYTRFI